MSKYTYQENLYSDLMRLVSESEAFYSQDREHEGVQYRIFNYRLTSYTDYMKPNALECRGHMFQVEGAVMRRLVSLPPEKFFNLYENPLTMNLDLSTIDLFEDKADGSLISTYLHVTADACNVRLKSKGSLLSKEALAAMKWLEGQSKFSDELHQLVAPGYTVNMEWVAPNNRIVIGYEEPELHVLSIRNNMTGEYLDREELDESYVEISTRWTKRIEINYPEEFVKEISSMQGIEGYVARLSSGQRVKIKTEWYLALHQNKSPALSSRRSLFEAVLCEATDDLKAMKHDDTLAIRQIEEMEAFVEEKYNHMVDSVERFYERNKHLERKAYAMLGKKEFDGTFYMCLAMWRYLGKEFSYKDFMKNKWRALGIDD